MSIIEFVTLALAVSSDDAFVREEDVDPLVAAADLIDSMVEGLGSNFAVLLNSSPRYGPQFLNMLVSLCRHEVAGVRMSALALVGDITRNTPTVLQPALSQIIHESISCLDTTQHSVAINAAWALGEICIQCKGQPTILEPYAARLLQNAIGLLMGSGVFDDGTTHYSTIPGLIENVSACVGRLALVDPKFVAPDLPRFLCGWCDGLGKIRDPSERHDAFTGFVQVIYANPQAMGHASGNVIDSMVSILFAILTWHIPEDLPDDSYKKMLTDKYRFVPFPASEADLGAALVKLVQDMKQSVGENEWQIVTKRLPVNVRKLFREFYNL
jgi:transportin-1